jgi:hypothetical protein
VAPDERDTDLRAPPPDVGKDPLGQPFVGRRLWEKQRGQEPPRYAPQAGDVVGVDVDGKPADLIRGVCDGIGLGDQIAVAEIEDGGVPAYGGTRDDTGVLNGLSPQDPAQKLRGQLAGKEFLIRCDLRLPP